MVLILFLMSVALLSWAVRPDSGMAQDSDAAKDLPLKVPAAESPVASPGVWQLARAIEEQAGKENTRKEAAVDEVQDAEAPRAGRIRYPEM